MKAEEKADNEISPIKTSDTPQMFDNVIQGSALSERFHFYHFADLPMLMHSEQEFKVQIRFSSL